MRACLVLVAGCAAGTEPAPTPPTAYSQAITALQPVGYWRLDDTTDVMLDATETTNGGYHGGPRLGDPGVSFTSAHFDGGAQYGEIADRGAFSLTRAWDDFDRTLIGTWGGAWRGKGDVIDGTASLESEQVMDLPLARGNLQIRTATDDAIALVAERTSSSSVRAELRSAELHLIATAGVVDTDLAAMSLGAPGGWWMLRFEFDGSALRARAWRDGDDEPSTWLLATAPSSAEGAIAIRGSGFVQAFRAQTLGLTLHVAVRLDDSDAPISQVLGKGDHSGFVSDTDQEYYLRINRDDAGAHLKGYAFDRDGGYGAGQSFDVETARWYDVVLEFDPGDYRDTDAGVSMFVDGVATDNGAGSRYHSNPCTPDHQICWNIDPKSGSAPLRIGTSDGETFFAGNLDELAVFDRLLTLDEITSLRR